MSIMKKDPLAKMPAIAMEIAENMVKTIAMLKSSKKSVPRRADGRL